MFAKKLLGAGVKPLRFSEGWRDWRPCGGHITLQYRAKSGANREHDLKPGASTRLRIDRGGDQFTLYAGSGDQGGQMQPEPGPVAVVLQDPVYLGIGVSAHNSDHFETATF